MHPLDSSSAVYPTLLNTWFIALVRSLSHKAINYIRKTPSSQEQEDLELDEDDDGSSITGSESGKSSLGDKVNGKALGGMREPTVKAGGKRRKAVTKRR